MDEVNQDDGSADSWFRRCLPVKIDCETGAIIMGNAHLPSLLVASFPHAHSMYSATKVKFNRATSSFLSTSSSAANILVCELDEIITGQVQNSTLGYFWDSLYWLEAKCRLQHCHYREEYGRCARYLEIVRRCSAVTFSQYFGLLQCALFKLSFWFQFELDLQYGPPESSDSYNPSMLFGLNTLESAEKLQRSGMDYLDTTKISRSRVSRTVISTNTPWSETFCSVMN